MPLDKQTITTIAHLSRLEIDANEIQKYQSELSSILGLVEQMEACDTSGIAPMTHPFDATLRLRPDQVTETIGSTEQRDKFQSLAPTSEEGLYLVPKVIE